MLDVFEDTTHNQGPESTEIASFHAGKMCRDAETGKVTADTRKGMLKFAKAAASGGSPKIEYYTLKWYDRESKAIEDSFILLPRVFEIKNVQSGRTAVYALYKRGAAAGAPQEKPKFIFWLQEAKESFDEKFKLIEEHLQVSQPPLEAPSAEQIASMRALFEKKSDAVAPASSPAASNLKLREFMRSEEVTSVLNENAEYYCRAIHDGVPEALRRDLDAPNLSRGDFQSILKSYIDHAEFREAQQILQSCVDNSWNPSHVAGEICGATSEAAKAGYCATPSVEALLRLFTAEEEGEGSAANNMTTDP